MKLQDIKKEHITRNEKTGKWNISVLPSEPVYEDILHKICDNFNDINIPLYHNNQDFSMSYNSIQIRYNNAIILCN